MPIVGRGAPSFLENQEKLRVVAVTCGAFAYEIVIVCAFFSLGFFTSTKLE